MTNMNIYTKENEAAMRDFYYDCYGEEITEEVSEIYVSHRGTIEIDEDYCTYDRDDEAFYLSKYYGGELA